MNRFPNVGVCFGLLLLLGTSVYAVSCEQVYALLNEDIVLTPQFTGELQEVLWKYVKDKIAEYTRRPESLEYFSSFKGRTELNTSDGSLTIKRVTFEDRGNYNAELQVAGRTQTHRFNIEVIRHVSKPTVTCNVNESIAMLHCMGDKNTETSFKWEGPEGQNRIGNTLMTLLKENDDSKYVCVTSNKKSEQRSDPFAVTDCKKAGTGDFPVWATALIVVILIVGALLCSILYFVCKKARGTQSMAGHNATEEEELDNVTSNEPEQGEQSNVRINETAPLMETNSNKSDSENEPGPEVLNVKDKKKIFEGAPLIKTNKHDSENKPGPEVLNVKDKKKISEGAPLIKTNKHDSENEPGPEVLNVKDKKKIFEGGM
ncbi:lymphocyte function-associated antigen 3-like [Acipenser oxyrinchus oxyrinchus]|uniref:Lymphocyte function-associated antigen 3-like n=1 Tax=Acipenser oxyrinchus oxyrinchus TaxID=40147 RepID=A0AAD8G8W0_ACIOX|nr:lymphocyte function-associated antigen 3-like [Acipenser oxyrinchus oxyrinchus]